MKGILRTAPGLGARINARSRLSGCFRLRSGSTATEYFDKYRFESDPELLAEVCSAMAELVPDGSEVLAGLELGGVPIATVMSQLTGLPAVFVRKEAKDYGTCQLAEGLDVAGRQLLVVEDVVTTAGQIVSSVKALRSEGASIDTALCVIDREAGGEENLRRVGIELRALFRMSEL
jgi:orotate phosphoribosyltransferase